MAVLLVVSVCIEGSRRHRALAVYTCRENAGWKPLRVLRDTKLKYGDIGPASVSVTGN